MAAARRWIIIILGGLVAAALLGAGLIAYMLTQIDARTEIERVVEANTGRDLTISGDVGLSFWPVLGLKARDATLANVEGGRAPAFIRMAELDIGVQIRPLFSRQVVVDRLMMRQPQIALEVDAQGRPNWLLTPERAPTQTPPPEPSVDVGRTMLREVRIAEGEVSFFDARRNTGWLVGDANLRTSIPSLDDPMQVEGSVRYNDRDVDLDVTVGSPRVAIRGERTTVRLEIESELLNAGFEGQTIAASGELAGMLNASGPNLRELASWVGAPIRGGVALEAFSVGGNVAIGEGLFSFSNASFSVDRISGRGDFTLAEVSGKPYLSGRLELFDFDANPYLIGRAPTPAEGEVQPSPQGGDTPNAAIAAVEAPPRAVDVQTAASETPINFSGLQAINADLELITHAVLVHRTRVDRARLNFVLNNGFLAMTIQDIRLYNGSGRGRLEIDAREPDVRIAHELTLDGVAARPFLTDIVNFNNIEGRAEVSVNLRTQGRTQSDMISNTDGNIYVEVISGTLHGVDLGGVSSTIRSALRGELIAPEARTPFQGFSATFAVSDGVLASNNLSFNTPDLRIPGIGVIDLPQRRLDVRLAPRSPRGGVVFPFSIRGPFGQFTYASDITDRARRDISIRVQEVQAASRRSRPAQ